MSDYMFNLESHLTAGQNAVLSAVQTAAGEANLGLFLTGGALRDMLGGFPIRDLDFTVEGRRSSWRGTWPSDARPKYWRWTTTGKASSCTFPAGYSARFRWRARRSTLAPGPSRW